MLNNKRVLITCGPTWVPIDSMRVISNRSTGTLGQMIAQDFAEAGAKVTLIEGPVAKPIQSKSIKVLKFLFFDELASLIKKELKKNYVVCIHAAAVSDYKVSKPMRTKLSSKLSRLKLNLVPTKKILYTIKRFNPDLFLVAFKLEPKITKALALKKSRSLFKEGKSDLVVANSLSGQKYSAYILDKSKKFLSHKKSRYQLSKILVKIVKAQI